MGSRRSVPRDFEKDRIQFAGRIDDGQSILIFNLVSLAVGPAPLALALRWGRLAVECVSVGRLSDKVGACYDFERSFPRRAMHAISLVHRIRVLCGSG
jgi:hypothetical protein